MFALGNRLGYVSWVISVFVVGFNKIMVKSEIDLYSFY